MNNDYLEQGDYYTSLYRLHQLTNRQLREERLRERPGPSLARRMLTAVSHSLRQRNSGSLQPRRRPRLRLS